MILTRFFLYGALTFYINMIVWSVLGHGQGWYALATLPGTFLHELAHYLTALALDGNPASFSIFPTWDDNGRMVSMGHITYYPNFYNAALVGLAPLLLAPIAVFFVALAARTMHPLKVIGWCYLAVCAWQSCVPSSADFDVHGFYFSYLLAAPGLVGSAYACYAVTRRTLKV